MSSRHDGELAPTARLRWQFRKEPVSKTIALDHLVLQQWWGQNAPSYMVDPNVGEWRDVEYDEPSTP